MKTGLLLLSGGASRRMGSPKHALVHPTGGSWGGHLVRVFESVFPGGPILVLGEPLPDRPELQAIEDPREGPAMALRHWAACTGGPQADRWWVVACDQVRWTPEALKDWAGICDTEDPAAARWVMALHAGLRQPLGGWLPEALRPTLAQATARSLTALAASLPHLVIPRHGPEWIDVDTPQERATFEAGQS